MRVNVYAEELTDEVELTIATPDTGKVYCGIRFYLESAERLHDNPNDDDRSAVTLWGPPAKLRDLLSAALEELDEAANTVDEAQKAQP